MKTNHLMRFTLCFALLTLAHVPTVSGLYNPTAGRWLNRDPITEQGGPNLYAHTRNSPIEKIDPRGLDVGGNGLFFRVFRGCICNGVLFDPGEFCCCNNSLVRKQIVETGIVTYKWKSPVPVMGVWPYHVWLQWPGGSIDSNASATPGISPDPFDTHSPA